MADVFKRRKTWFLATILLVLVVVFLITRGPEAPTPNPPGAFSFAVLGDAPYFAWEDLQYGLVLQSLDANDLSWVIDVGDIFWRPCTDELYRKNLERFNGLRHPVIYTPGDNDWTDCWEPESGGFGPRDRLDRVRQIFFNNPTRSLGGTTLWLVSQAGREPFPEFVENARWAREGIVFATVHIVGSKNGLKPFPARTEADDTAWRRRTDAAASWVRETFVEARSSNASAVVLSFHANAELEAPADHPDRQAFEPFITAIEEEAERFARPVLLTHGDGHEYTLDQPLVRRTTGRRLENVTRLQVPGSPEVGWVRVVVTPGAENPFAFEAHVVPRWKYW
ncbi:MAG TPA: metallophosphoesterase [Blastocatellia bacterium]|nr:metallophosphoesterase [Blastocatellia bacterium]